MSHYASYIALILLLPLLSFAILGLCGKKYLSKAAGIIGTVVLIGVTILSFITAYNYFFIDGKINGVYREIIPVQYQWLQFTDDLFISIGASLTPISVMMLVVISFVSLMVHIFSLGYMKGEQRFATYYAFLSLFTFSMLGLIVSTNIFEIYIFWELVGASSYLLIGFYFDKPSAVAASKKAFIVTRFADFGFLIGIFILSFNAHTLDFQTLIQRLTTLHSPEFMQIASASFMGLSAFTWALALVFMGAAGKSAMFPFHIWLPDAMEGPTPVSALIHAATMVVAGVYLVARLYPLFSMDIAVLQLITCTGIFSAAFAAIIACTQTDIKRVLAYSTMSQIGYMFFSLGIGRHGSEQSLGFTASLFHLFTHGFFKSLLFLCAGSIIHAVHSNEMKDMGGLRKQMPLTHFAFLIACFSIAGIPPFAGFFSKEEILSVAFHANKWMYVLAVATAALTAFYMFRLYFMIFHHKPAIKHAHHEEGTFTMKLPLLLLACCTVFAGFIPFGNYISADGAPLATHINFVEATIPISLAIAAIIFAAVLYKKENALPAKIAASLNGFYTIALKKFYIDEIYLFITKKIIFNLIAAPAAWIDKNIVDGTINLLAKLTAKIADIIKVWQSGKVQQYAMYFYGGIAVLAVWLIYFWK